jgi:xylitol oxidase
MIAADDLWLSPFYKRPSTAFHFSFNKDWPAVSRLLPELEAALAPFQPLPHWGKLFTMPPATIQSGYARLPDFRDLLATYDAGKFRNRYVETYVFGR